jgi:hypothetical protein
VGNAREDNWSIFILFILTLFFGYLSFQGYKKEVRLSAMVIAPLTKEPMVKRDSVTNEAMQHFVKQISKKQLEEKTYEAITAKNYGEANDYINLSYRLQKPLDLKVQQQLLLLRKELRSKGRQKKKSYFNYAYELSSKVNKVTLFKEATKLNAEQDNNLLKLSLFSEMIQKGKYKKLFGASLLLKVVYKVGKLSPSFKKELTHKLMTIFPYEKLAELDFSNYGYMMQSIKEYKIFNIEPLIPLLKQMLALKQSLNISDIMSLLPYIYYIDEIESVLPTLTIYGDDTIGILRLYRSDTTKKFMVQSKKLVMKKTISKAPEKVKEESTSYSMKFVSLVLLFVVSLLSLFMALVLKMFVWRRVKPVWVREM